MKMKKNILKSLIGGFLVAAAFSCEMELPTYADYSDYTFSGLDTDGGTWTPILLVAANQIPLAAPDASTYQSELAALKAATTSLESNQRNAVRYWTNNPAMRWNEIAIELIAKYNLIPGPNDDNTYTLPNAANPAGPPAFPFAHPPYACRTLAYLSVGQLDGLITAWHYKYLYNRQAPSKTDPTITASYVENNIPSYPSDGAVIAAVSRDILIALFPLEKEFIEARAKEHVESLIWAGANVSSDVAAGQFIGAEVAKVALARAANDGMKNAQTPKPVSDAIKAAAFNRFGWQWDNIEVPPRPVGLTPMFGNVQLWNVPSVVDVRPGPPPVPGSEAFKQAADELQNISDNMTPEKRKIANWWADGLGTYSPPGHWNRFAKEFIIKYKMNPIRAARTMAYMNMAIMDAGVACWDAKYYYHYPRPINAIPGFKVILGTPNFPSYTSGHSTFSSAASEVLSAIFPQEAALCNKWALEAAESRIYAGIHYRFDSEVGLTQGKNVAQYTITKMNADGAGTD